VPPPSRPAGLRRSPQPAAATARRGANASPRTGDWTRQLPGGSPAPREFAGLAFRGLELIPPGVVLVSEWRPDVVGPRPTPAQVNCYGGVARKP